jgi:hypothetical protein
MKLRHRISLMTLALCSVLALSSCAPETDQVELRLFPCEFEGVEPRAVVVEITGFDASGEVVETFEVGFDDISASVFDDGYATVGYRSDPSVVTARFRVGWFPTPEAGSIADAEAVAVYEDLDVPPHGQALNLGSEIGDCTELAGDGDGDMTGDGDGDMTGDGDGDMTGDGDGDGDPTGDGDGDPTGDGDGDPTGDGDGDPTGDGDCDMTGDGDGDMTGDGDGDGDPTGDGDGDPNVPMIGDDCVPDGFHCSPLPNGDAGTPLRCMGGKLMASDLFPQICGGLCPIGITDEMPVDACGNYGYPAVCLCAAAPAENCNAPLGCDGDTVRLCHNNEVVVGSCPSCVEMNGYYTCNL